METVLQLTEVNKTYNSGFVRVKVLRNVNFSLKAGEVVSVVGPSGSGKTTFLSLCAGLDRPSAGEIKLLDHDLGKLNENELARIRSIQIGFVFQSFHLMPSLTALENVMLPLELCGGRDAEAKARDLLQKVGLGSRLPHYPAQLSRGEQQRVAIARAFINEPKILFADEPTGNLDQRSSDLVVKLLFELNRDYETSLMLITHDESLAQRTQRIMYIKEGFLLEGRDSAGALLV